MDEKIAALTEEELDAAVGGSEEEKYSTGDIVQGRWCPTCEKYADQRCTKGTFLAGVSRLTPVYLTLWECMNCGQRSATNTR